MCRKVRCVDKCDLEANGQARSGFCAIQRETLLGQWGTFGPKAENARRAIKEMLHPFMKLIHPIPSLPPPLVLTTTCPDLGRLQSKQTDQTKAATDMPQCVA